MTTALDYARVTIDLPLGADPRRIWRRLGSVEGRVAVNVVDATGQPALITDAVVAELQTGSRRAITIEALPERRYLEIASGKLDLALADVPVLRAAWRTRPIGDTATTLQTLLQRLTELALLVSLLGHQRARPTLVTAADRLRALGAQLAASAFQLDDTVRASDDVHYELLPVLRRLQPLLRPTDQSRSLSPR